MPESTPSAEILRTAARKLFEAGDKQSARKILELVFAREISEHKLVAANFLGLAEIRLASGDTPGALDLLHRLVVVVGNPFENLDPAAALLEKTGHNAEAMEFLDQLVKSAPWDSSYRLRLAKAKLAANTDAENARDALAGIASSPSTSYGLRLRASAALAGRSRSDLGSGELNLLAGAPGAITPAAADKFYYYEARIKAAQNASDAQTKIQLLSHCIIDVPRRDEARIPLFHSATAARSDEYALGVLEPLFQTAFLQAYGNQAADEEEQIISSGEEEEETSEETNTSAVPAPKLTRAEQAQIARMISDTMVRLDRLSEAAQYYETARNLDAAPAVRRTLMHILADVRSALRIQRRNAARQPLLHEPLEQDRVVRPRLLARVVPAAKPAAAKGGVKQ